MFADVGASQLIIDGKIGLKSGSQISHFTKEGIVFEDGSTLSADAVVFATGCVHSIYLFRPLLTPQSLNAFTRYGKPLDLLTELAGKEVAARTKPIMDLDAEGELNTYWRFSGVEGLYHMMGGCFSFSGFIFMFLLSVVPGNLALCRFHSKHLALRKTLSKYHWYNSSRADIPFRRNQSEGRRDSRETLRRLNGAQETIYSKHRAQEGNRKALEVEGASNAMVEPERLLMI